MFLAYTVHFGNISFIGVINRWGIIDMRGPTECVWMVPGTVDEAAS